MQQFFVLVSVFEKGDKAQHELVTAAAMPLTFASGCSSSPSSIILVSTTDSCCCVNPVLLVVCRQP